MIRSRNLMRGCAPGPQILRTAPESQVRTRLLAGGDRIRTIGPRVMYAFGIGSGRFTRASGKVGVKENDGTRRSRGTDGSNPVPSSGESGANLIFPSQGVPHRARLTRRVGGL